MPIETSDPTPDRWLSLDLEPRIEAAQVARELITTACARWHRERLTDLAQVAVSEMVNNAVIHAGTSITVRVVVDQDELLIAVRDGSTELPRPRVAAPTSYGGRGLMLLDAVSARWGCTPQAGGKVVWAVLS